MQIYSRKSERQDRFDVAASLQAATKKLRDMIQGYLDKKPDLKYIFSGGVVLNSIMMGKMWDWFKGKWKILPATYDSGLAIGSAMDYGTSI